MNMLLTEELLLDHSEAYAPTHDSVIGDTDNDYDLDSLLHSNDYEDFEDEIQDEQWLQKLSADWQCIASDYSVQYKLMNEHYNPLHTNNLAINLQRSKTVGDYKVVDITRCSYEVHENKNVRVSVNAKLVLRTKNKSRH